MYKFFFKLFFIFLFSFCCYSQILFKNPINGVKPNLYNPYTIGQTIDSNCTVSGISRGTGILGKNANNRYNATGWNSLLLDENKYFEFVISPLSGKKINFLNFKFIGQVSSQGPLNFSFRSSLDGFSNDIGIITATGSIIDLSSVEFQNCMTPIVFRIYAWGAIHGTGTFSVNSFEFTGTTDCIIAQAPLLSNKIISCTATSFDISWLPSDYSDSYILDVAYNSDFTTPLVGYFNLDLGDISNQQITGITAATNYYVRLRSKNDCGLSEFSNTSSVTSPVSTFDGITWNNGVPNASIKAIYKGNATINTTIEACSCQIDSGANVVVGVSGGLNDTAILKLENGLDVLGTGTLTFENNASLVQVNDAAVNSGNIIYKRVSMPMKNFDYTDWSSPVTPQKLVDLSPNTLSDKYYSFENRVWIVEDKNNEMLVAKGYAIRTPKEGTWPNGDIVAFPYSQPVSFVGVPNNGVINKTVNINSGRYSFIGNPYPSALNADTFITTNSNDIKGTIYIWTHNTAIDALGKYSQDDYASYNIVGGTVAGSGGVEPTGSIAAGQGFFVISKVGTSGSIVYNNTMRESDPAGNSQFFRSSKTKKSNIDKHRVWLNLTNNEGAFKQLLVGYITGATNGIDDAFDGSNYTRNAYVDFYSLLETKKYVIQGRALPFTTTDEVPLGFKSTIDGKFTISLAKADGILANQEVFLKDKSTNLYHNLKNGSFTFETLKGTFDNRFVLVYIDKSFIESIPPIDNFSFIPSGFEAKSKSVIIVENDQKLKLYSKNEIITKLYIYNVEGKLIYSNSTVNAIQYVIDSIPKENQILLIKSQLQNGLIEVTEILY